MFSIKKQKTEKIDYTEKKLKKQKYKKIERFFFWSLLLFLIFSFFARNNFKSVKNPSEELFFEPVKTELSDHEPIEISKDGFRFTLTPLYDYKMSALVVNRLNYNWFSLTRSDNVFPMDLCVTWGENIKNGSYRDKSVSFRQDFRFCLGSWGRDSDFIWAEVSNNHLVIDDDRILKKAMSIVEGDQIRLKGKLVNVKIENIDGKLGKYENQLSNWNSSVNIGDSGAGACEVIFVEELEIIKKANPIFFYGFQITSFILVIFIIWKIGIFFYEILRGK